MEGKNIQTYLPATKKTGFIRLHLGWLQARVFSKSLRGAAVIKVTKAYFDI
jgi:hypothetical protein